MMGQSSPATAEYVVMASVQRQNRLLSPSGWRTSSASSRSSAGSGGGRTSCFWVHAAPAHRSPPLVGRGS